MATTSYSVISFIFSYREVIDVIGTMTYIGALFVYSDNLQVIIDDCVCTIV